MRRRNPTDSPHIPPVLRAALGALVSLGGLAGCIASPADGMVVSDTNQRLNFNGFHPYSRAPVRVKAYDFSAGRYNTVTTGISSTSLVGYWEDPLYEWSAPSVVLGANYWAPGRCAGARALIDGETTVSGRTYGMYSWNLERNAEGCIADNPNNSDWLNNCSSNASNLRTANYSDAARPLGVTFATPPQADDTCTGVYFTYHHPTGQWSDVQASYRVGATTYGLACAVTSESRGTTYGRCTRNLGSIAGVRTLIESLRTSDLQLNASAREESCRDRLRSSQATTFRASTYDYNWTRWSGYRPQCTVSTPPPPPPPPSDPRTYAIQCFCTNVAGTNGLIGLNACMESSAMSLVTGAGFMCGYAAVNLQALSGLATTCAYSSMSGPGATCTRAGDWSFSGQ